MGVARIICHAIMGPLIIYFVLMAHLWYHMLMHTPESLKVPSWPSSTNAKDKEAIIAARKPLIKDLMDLMAAKNLNLGNKYLTEDAEWEDPFSRFVGGNEVRSMFYLVPKIVKNAEFKVFGEHHSAHEVVMDWEVKTWMTLLPNYPIAFRLRTHILLEPSTEKVGGQEKIFKIYEEWYGNFLLNEKTITPSFLGQVHSKLRRFHGFFWNTMVVKGIL